MCMCLGGTLNTPTKSLDCYVYLRRVRKGSIPTILAGLRCVSTPEPLSGASFYAAIKTSPPAQELCGGHAPQKRLLVFKIAFQCAKKLVFYSKQKTKVAAKMIRSWIRTAMNFLKRPEGRWFRDIVQLRCPPNSPPQQQGSAAVL